MDSGKEFINEAYRAIFHKDYKKAIELFKKAIHRNPNRPSYYYKLSITYARNNNLRDAMAAIKQAIRLDPDCTLFKQQEEILEARVLSNQALHLLVKPEYEFQAMELLKKSIQLDPLNSQVRVLYAWLLKKSGRTEDAVYTLQELLALDPLNKEAKELLLQCHNES